MFSISVFYTFTLVWLASISNVLCLRHIVVILADDLGWNDIGYHNKDIISPNIDELAKQGVILNRSYVQPLCTPSRSALLSGVYPFRDGLQRGVILPDVPKCIPFHRTLLPEKLKELGYETHMVGKWHLGMCNERCTPTFRGFDTFLGFFNGGEDFYSKEIMEYKDFYNNTNPAMNKEYSTTLYGKRAVEIIENHDENKALFLYLAFQAPHCPLQVPDKYLDMYPLMANDRRRILSAMITAMDEAIGNVVEALKRKNIHKNTLIVFSSDNGGEPPSTGSNYPLRGAKRSVFEGGTRAVGFVYGSGLVNKGTVYDGLIHIVDWFPTLIVAAGGHPEDLSDNLDGVNQWDAIRFGRPSARNEMVYNLDKVGEVLNGAIRYGDFKLLVGYPGIWRDWYIEDEEYFSKACNLELEQLVQSLMESDSCNRHLIEGQMLFNVTNDPYELNDLSESFPYIVDDLYERMQYHKDGIIEPEPNVPNPKSDPRLYGGYWSPGWC